VIIVGLLAGCGAGDGGGAGGGGAGGGGTGNEPATEEIPPELQATPPDPCTLVTTEEASAALTVPMNDCELLGQDPFFATARFLLANGDPGEVQLDVANGGAAMYESVKQDAEGQSEFAEVPGIGDAAFFVRPFSSAVVTFLEGPFVVTVSVSGATGPATQEATVTLAQQAAGRVPTG
jgi:hypothetical protein